MRASRSGLLIVPMAGRRSPSRGQRSPCCRDCDRRTAQTIRRVRDGGCSSPHAPRPASPFAQPREAACRLDGERRPHRQRRTPRDVPESRDRARRGRGRRDRVALPAWPRAARRRRRLPRRSCQHRGARLPSLTPCASMWVTATPSLISMPSRVSDSRAASAAAPETWPESDPPPPGRSAPATCR